MKAIVGKVGISLYTIVIVAIITSTRADALTTGFGVILTAFTLGVLVGIPALCGYLIAQKDEKKV